jgi:hypothetical protein
LFKMHGESTRRDVSPIIIFLTVYGAVKGTFIVAKVQISVHWVI